MIRMLSNIVTSRIFAVDGVRDNRKRVMVWKNGPGSAKYSWTKKRQFGDEY
jgi:hypothetical protein